MRGLVLTVVAFACGLGIADAKARREGSSGIPELNYTATCKATPPVAMDQQQTLNSCLNDEKQAKTDLPKQWARSKQEWRSSCLRQTTLGGLASYVELITCLEMHDPNPPSLNRPSMTQPATAPNTTSKGTVLPQTGTTAPK